MKVSIAMAVYNGEKFIKQQLDSFLSQTLLPDELIITDDCSSDRTEDVVKEFAERAPFDVFYHRNDRNLGYCGNFNHALIKTKGDLVFLSDQDDVWLPSKIEKMCDIASKHPDAFVYLNDAELTDGRLNKTGLTKLGQIRSAGYSDNDFVMGCCCAVRRELLDICLPIPEESKGHDNWIVAFGSGLNRKLIVNEVLQLYRRHGENESNYLPNITKKVSKLDSLKFSLNRLTKIDASDYHLTLDRLALMDEALGRASDKTNGDLRGDIVAFSDHLNRKSIFLKERIKIREKPFFLRVILVVRFSLNGGYNGIGGMKSLLRDIYGKNGKTVG